jgi:dolichol-phosphate mannosyltransferase
MTKRLRCGDLTMVVPTYNEQGNLGRLLERLFTVCESHGVDLQVIVVDDSSTDGTGEVAEEWARGARVRVIHRPEKLGLGSAVLAGFAQAGTEVVGVIDADLSHPPELIPLLWTTLHANELDMVVASRYVPNGGSRGWSLRRFVLSRLGCALAGPLTPVRDAMSGFFLLRTDRVLNFNTPETGFKICLELLVRGRPQRVAEVGYVFVDRDAGRSKLTIREGLTFLRQLLRLYAHALSTSRSIRPELVNTKMPRATPSAARTEELLVDRAR